MSISPSSDIEITLEADAAAAAPDSDQTEARALLGAIARGDSAAFAELHQRFSGLVYATAVKVLQNHEDAADTAQEVFATVWDKAGRYLTERGKPSTWLTAIARNRAIDRVRGRERRQRLMHAFGEEPESLKGWRAPSPSDTANVSDLATQARSRVLELSGDQRQAIQWAFFDGLTETEISQRTGAPLGTVKARIRRGLLKLRTLMQE